jgi:hypothetical protein
MTYEEMTEKLNQKVYEKNNGQGFFDDLVELHNLDPADPIASRMYSKAWENGHSAGYYEVFLHFNDLVEVFKG